MQSHLSWRSRSSPSTGLLDLQPLPHQGAVHVVVVQPALVAGVVGRVDVDALDPACVAGQQGLQRVEIVAVDDQVVVLGRRVQGPPGIGNQTDGRAR